jgi:hypothetical protein
MSEHVVLSGKVKKVKFLKNETLEEACKRILIENKIDLETKMEYYDNYVECLIEELYKKYEIIDDEIFEIISCKNHEYSDIFEMKQNEDGTFDYLLSYYNGGCSFGEALQEAYDEFKKKEKEKCQK